MKLKYVHLCDHAFQSEGGKLNFIGIFKNINIQKFPGGLPKFSLVCGLEIPSTISGKLKLETIFMGPDEKKIKANIPTLSGILPKRKKGVILEFGSNIEIVNFKFKTKGKYKFLVKLNGKDVGKITFDVLQSPQEKK